MSRSDRLRALAALLFAALALTFIVWPFGRDEAVHAPAGAVLELRRVGPVLEGSGRDRPPQDPEPAPARISGRVEDEQGRAVPGARVCAHAGEDVLAGCSWTAADSSGEFSANVPAGDLAGVRVFCVASGYLPAAVAANVRETVVVVLRRGLELHGEVVDELGSPVPGATVCVSSAVNRLRWPWWEGEHGVGLLPESEGSTVRSNSTGGFTVSGLSGTTPLTVSCAAPNYVAAVPYVRVERLGEPVRVVLRTLWSLSVEVVDAETSAPIDACWVTLGGPSGFETCAYETALFSQALLSQGAPVTPVAASMRYHFMRLPVSEVVAVAEVRLRVEASGYEAAEAAVPIQPGLRSERVALRRTGRQAAGRVWFQLHGQNRAPYRGPMDVVITANPPSGKPWFARCVFENGRSKSAILLAEGLYKVRPRGGAFDAQTQWLNPAGPTQDLEVRADREVEVPLTLVGTPVLLNVLDEQSRPVMGYDLSASPEKGRVSGSVFRWDVVRRLRVWQLGAVAETGLPVVWLPAGDCILNVSMPGVGYGGGRVTCDGSGELMEVRIQLRSE